MIGTTMTLQITDGFGEIKFSGVLRPSQVAASSIIEKQLDSQSRRLHIVAPPGSGKTVLGLYVWSDLVRKPTLVLSPNSAIQSQWAARTSLFDLDDREHLVSTDPMNPGLLTSLTYQSITLPSRGDENLESIAIERWAEKLIEVGEAHDFLTAEFWQNDLKQRNPDYYRDRLGFYRKQVRDEEAKKGEAMSYLHSSSLENLERLKDAGIGLIILDECHHLLHHWGRVLAEISPYFDNPTVLGLTATPPCKSGASPEDIERYGDFLGPVDYEVPVPALVRDGNLAPYQDLAYFVRPTGLELKYLAEVDKDFDALITTLREPRTIDAEQRVPPLLEWVETVVVKPAVAGIQFKAWPTMPANENTVDDFLNASRVYLERNGKIMPHGVPLISPSIRAVEWTNLSLLTPIIDRYIRHGLRLSQHPEDHALAENAIAQFRLLGRQISETGVRAAASPVTRVMAYAQGKVEALPIVLAAEKEALGDSIRVVVVTDFEKTSSMALVEGVLDEEAGGAVAVFRRLVTHPETDALDPVLMTGTTVLVDDDLVVRFLASCREWISEKGLSITLEDVEIGPYHEIRGRGKDWLPRYYTEMITELFQQGLTRCIVGTRGLLGEGWDASRINVLIDLTTVTTKMSINQLRGRSFRLDKEWPEKVSNNWDIVCLAEEFTRGFSDYERFEKKHKQLYGVCDDSAIEMGVGHVHAAFTETTVEGVNEGMGLLNQEMLRRAGRRDQSRIQWRIGEPFDAEPRAAIEISPTGMGNGFPLGAGAVGEIWTDNSLTDAIAQAVFESMQSIGLLPSVGRLGGGERGGGWMRLYLEECNEEQSIAFCSAMGEVFGSLDSARYIIPRSSRFFVKVSRQTFLSKYFPFLFKDRIDTNIDDRMMMWHAVPKALSKNKKDVERFQIFWNVYVSTGTAIYARSESGKNTVNQAIASGLIPKAKLHEKRVFL